MDIKELESWLTEGLDEGQKAVVIAALNRDTVKTKAATLKDQKEFAAIEAQRQALEAELAGSGAQPGSRAYREWYDKNWKTVDANAKAIAAYDKKHGDGAFATLSASIDSGGTPPATGTGAGGGLSKEDVLKLVSEQFQNVQAPNIANVLKTTGKLVQKHMYAKRTNPIDFDELDKLMGAAQKADRNMSLVDAYDQWDKPERDKVEATNRENEIQKRVKEELQKRGASSNFPAGGDMTPSALSQRSKSDIEKFDKTALQRDLANTWNNPESVQ